LEKNLEKQKTRKKKLGRKDSKKRFFPVSPLYPKEAGDNLIQGLSLIVGESKENRI